MPPAPEPVALPRSGVAVLLLALAVLIFVAPFVLAAVAWASGGEPAVVWGVGGGLVGLALYRIAGIGAIVTAAGITIRNPLRTVTLAWADVDRVRWQCRSAGALDRVLPPNCRLLVEPVGPASSVPVHATVFAAPDQRDLLERVVRQAAPASIGAFGSS